LFSSFPFFGPARDVDGDGKLGFFHRMNAGAPRPTIDNHNRNFGKAVYYLLYRTAHRPGMTL
jgi:hypothetical protein